MRGWLEVVTSILAIVEKVEGHFAWYATCAHDKEFEPSRSDIKPSSGTLETRCEGWADREVETDDMPQYAT